MKIKTITLGLLLLIGLAAVAMAADDYKRHPGYVDFEKMGLFGETEATVEITLKGSLLNMIIGGLGEEDPELSDMLSKLQFVHVQVFSVDELDIAALESRVKKASKKLEKDGWEVVVRVHDKKSDEQVYLYILPTKSDQIISGLVVMVIEEDNEAVFINVVGDLDPEQIGRLGHTFGIDHLEGLDIHQE
jgi:hypothetical protein